MHSFICTDVAWRNKYDKVIYIFGIDPFKIGIKTDNGLCAKSDKFFLKYIFFLIAYIKGYGNTYLDYHYCLNMFFASSISALSSAIEPFLNSFARFLRHWFVEYFSTT